MPVARASRNVSLTAELDAFIEAQLAGGDYGNASEVVRAALRLLRARDAAPDPTPWPVGGGACGALIREGACDATALGPARDWPDVLRTTVAGIVASPVAQVLMWGPDNLLLYNDAYAAIIAHRHPAALGRPVEAVLPEVWDFNRGIVVAIRRGETVVHRNRAIELARADGPETLVMDLYYTPVRLAGGAVGGVVCTCIDNSRRVEIEARLATSEAELRRVTDALPMLVSYIDGEQRYRFVSQQYQDWFGVAPGDAIGRTVREIIGEIAYADRRPSIERALAGETVTSEGAVPHADGSLRRVEFRYVPRIAGDGGVLGVHIFGLDVEERATREAALAASNTRFRTAMDAVHGVLWTNSADGRMLGEQPGWAALTGQSFAEYQGYGWADAVHPDDAQPTVDAWHAALAAKSMFAFEHRVRRHCGGWRSFAIRALPILDGAGEIVEWVGVHTDITHQRAAEAALREQAAALSRQIIHRERAEAQLRHLNETLEARVIAEIDERRIAEAKLAQAQKMETVGKLTGGVAHDFNNLLQVVSGNLQLLARDVAGNERAERRVENAMAGVARGSKLAAQLLAFGRRQALEPKVVDVTRFVRNMDDILRRAIGEGVEIETVFAGGLWNTFIDPTQIENALLNLAINARDAMEGEGKLTIELANAHLDDAYARTHDEVTPGQYVMLAVTDTGSGMTADVMDKVFEPFFSTKAEGKGSGLGLSMVYGFVRQSGGHVKIYSEPGEGTTIRLYLPRAMQAEDVEVAVEAGPVAGGSETVLVVEDDAEVRATVVEMLADLGYRVLKAVDAASALNVVESGIAIDLLFTDVVMPGTLKSPEMARRAKARLPGLAVLFTSGYTENSIVHGGRLDAGVQLLSKPYTREALARKVRHVIANEKQRAIAAAPRGEPAAAEPGRTVLLVEDDALIRASTAEILQESGWIVVDAASAEDAVGALRAVPIDVLVTDVNLPGASGCALARQARTWRPGIGIVFATGDPGGIDLADGAVTLAKPFGIDALLAAIDAAHARVTASS